MDPDSNDIEIPSSPSPRRWGWIRFAEVLVFLGALLLVRSCLHSSPEEPLVTVAVSTPPPPPVAMAPAKPTGRLYGPPTPQRRWRDVDDPKVYMPTGSGRIISASYGSVRTRSSGRASFHEGVDVSPTVWERGKAKDPVFSISDGKVVYTNKIGGNSSFGKYVVVEHQDDLGKVYSLYSHLASVEGSKPTGSTVRKGDVLGIMGHTSTLGIPPQRSHLHLELCMMLNPEFDRWYRSKKLKPNHRAYHGFNLAGLNPHLLLSRLHEKEEAHFSYKQALEQTPVAWTMLIKTSRRPHYFRLYPSLWKDAPFQGNALVIEASESGIPLSGRNATSEELAAFATGKTKVLSVNKETLGRNGLRHVVNDKGTWRIGTNGTRWLDIFLFQ